MQSPAFSILAMRARTLKRRFLPPTNSLGIYTVAQQDNMRALRMLFHAEVEGFLESQCGILISDLRQELTPNSKTKHPIKFWANHAATVSTTAAAKNNGVTKSCILKMFENLGFPEEEINTNIPAFLDKLTAFGKNRGDVAHRSAYGATYQMNKIREEKMIDEVLRLLGEFDRMIVKRRVTHSINP